MQETTRTGHPHNRPLHRLYRRRIQASSPSTNNPPHNCQFEKAMIVERENLSTVLASAKMSPTTIPANGEKQQRSNFTCNGESIRAGTAVQVGRRAGSDSAPAKQQQNAFSAPSSHVEREPPSGGGPAAALPKAHMMSPPSTTTAQAATHMHTCMHMQQQQQPSSSVAPNAPSAHAHTSAHSSITNSEAHAYDQSQVGLYAHHAAAAQSAVVVGSSAAAPALGGVQYVQAPPPHPSSSYTYYHHPTGLGGDNNHHQITPSFHHHHGYPPQQHPTATAFVTTTATPAPDAIHHHYRHHPNSAYPPPPHHHQISVPGPSSAPAPAMTNSPVDLAGSAPDEMAEIAAQSAKLRQIQRLEQEVVKRRRLLEATLTARYGGAAAAAAAGGGGGGGGMTRGRNSPPTSSSPPAPDGTHPPPSSLPPSSSLYSSDGTSEGGHAAARSGHSMHGQSFPSPLHHHPRSLSAPMAHRHEHQHQQPPPPHFSPNPSLGEPLPRSALPPFALAPSAGAGAGAAGSGPYPQASSGRSTAARSTPGAQGPAIPSTSMICTSGVPHYTDRYVVPLGLGDEDRNHITEYLCFVRNEIIEIFPATASDVHSDGNARGVVQGQVGMRCRFCAHRKRFERANRSTSYPSSVSRMYQSLTMMMREHLPACSDMPPDVRERYNALKAGNTGSRTKESKRYWTASAHSIGLVDTEDGIRMRPPTTAAPSVLVVHAPQP